ncbi:MAG TPA: nucleotidyltransferase domain-containing protein [Pseudobdellovibrionaceae bacterium]|jgi:predicted nucleotidyltransferase
MNIKTVKTLTDFFNSKKEIEIAILYGSFAKGTETNESDIDLAVSLASPLTAQDKISYIDELSLLTHKTIDLVDLREIHVPLSQEVFLTGKVIKNKNKSFWEWLIRRMIYEVSDFLPMRRKEQINRIKKFIGNKSHE